MRRITYILVAVFGLLFLGPKPPATAQIHVGIGIGVEPVCPYGYYGYAPYRCSPYGYYGPEWFSGGRFVGAGGWYHGGPGFYGHVNHQYDPRFGYRGAYPGHGPYQEHPDHFQHFNGSRYSDPHGHYHTEAQHNGYVNGGHPR